MNRWFTLFSPTATRVQIAGEFTGWLPVDLDRGDDGGWGKQFTGLLPGTYGYKFIVDGNWMLDPNNAGTKIFNGAENSTGIIPSVGEVWLDSDRGDGQPGSGAPWDPFDVSTPDKFDALMLALGPYTTINLPPLAKTFIDHLWTPQDGWMLKGAGMYATTLQMVAPPGYVPSRAGGFGVIYSPYNENRTGVILRDFTIDANWEELAPFMPNGATVRTFHTSAAVVSSPNIPSDDGVFTSLDLHRQIVGPGIPDNIFIGVINSFGSIGLSSSAVRNIPVTLTIPIGTELRISEKNCCFGASYIPGANNCRYENIRAIHGFGSGANGEEMFLLGLSASFAGGGSNSHMDRCLAEMCYGNYGNPFAMAGIRNSPSYPGQIVQLRACSVENCVAIGEQGIMGYSKPGSMTPFTSGGVNMADVENIRINGSTFIDCGTACYIDTGFYDGIEFADNTVIRATSGVGFVVDPTQFPGFFGRNVRVIGNRLGIQRRLLGGANYGIVVRDDCFPWIEGNGLTYDRTGPGNDVYWPIQIVGTGGTVINNRFDYSEYALVGDNGNTNGQPDARYRLNNNRLPDGSAIVGLADTF